MVCAMICTMMILGALHVYMVTNCAKNFNLQRLLPLVSIILEHFFYSRENKNSNKTTIYFSQHRIYSFSDIEGAVPIIIAVGLCIICIVSFKFYMRYREHHRVKKMIENGEDDEDDPLSTKQNSVSTQLDDV